MNQTGPQEHVQGPVHSRARASSSCTTSPVDPSRAPSQTDGTQTPKGRCGWDRKRQTPGEGLCRAGVPDALNIHIPAADKTKHAAGASGAVLFMVVTGASRPSARRLSIRPDQGLGEGQDDHMAITQFWPR